MLYIVIWIITLFMSTVIFQKVSGSLSILKPNMISLVFYYSLLVSSFIGSLLIVLGIDDYYMINRLDNPEIRVIGFSFVAYIMVALPLSMLIVSKLARFQAKNELNQYLKAPIVDFVKRKNEFYFIILGLCMLSVLGVAYTFLMIDKVPLFALFTGSDNLAQLRIEASHGFSGNTLIRNIFGIGLAPILSFVTYLYWVQTKQRRWKYLFFVEFIAAILINTYDLAKAPIFFYIFMFILLRIYIGKTKLTLFRVFMIGFIGVFSLIIIYVFVQNVTNIDSFLAYNSGPVGRLILAQISPFFLHLDLFGHQAPFLYGKSLPSSLLGLYDIEQLRSAQLAMEVYFPERVEKGVAGVLNTLFAAEAYANFGYQGIILGTLYVGMIIQLVYITFLRLPKHPIFVSLFIYFMVNLPRVVVTGFADFLLNPLWIILVFLLITGLLYIRIKDDTLVYFRKGKEYHKEKMKKPIT